INLEMVLVSIGVLILAMGSAGLNQFQEREFDKLMARTMKRPIPSGKISPATAMTISIVLVLFGFSIVVVVSNIYAGLLGLLTLVWYNFIYTPLKRKTSIAVVPGAFIGALPPAIGWVAAGGELLDMKLIIIALFLFMWQIPHFWLLSLYFSKDYKAAGYPTLNDKFSEIQIERITVTWIAALTVFSLLVPFYFMNSGILLQISLVIGSIWLLFNSLKLFLKGENKISYKNLFMKLNIYVLISVVILTLDKLI
ncbi:MAG: protoheme IX farnesyltransferase, partial [Melioribacteraceae bacterium]|nr:protoheme IX farnesyltransferase [Melioribacteraceae bacterium]